MLTHHKWEKSGRTFKTDKPNQFVYKSSIGQQNVALGNGEYAPYVWDKTHKIVWFADCELRFTPSGLEFWRGEKRLNTLAFHPEVKSTDSFERPVATASGLTVEHIDPGNSKAEAKLSYTLTTDDQETLVSVRAGYNAKVHFGVRIKALRAGEQRVTCEFAEKFEAVQQYDRNGNPVPITRLATKDAWWAWSRDESADHEIEQTEITRVRLGDKVYKAGEEKEISPDTWGSDVGIAANGDDGFGRSETEDDWEVSGWLDGIYYGDIDSWGGNGAGRDIGVRWDNITIAGTATIDTTYIDLYASDESGDGVYEGDPTGTIYAWDHDDAPQFSDGTSSPSYVTHTSASESWTPSTSSGWKTTPNLKSVTQEIIDRASWSSGNAINFCLIGTSNSDNGNDFMQFQDYNSSGTNEAELTITYTAAGGESALPMAMNYYRQLRN